MRGELGPPNVRIDPLESATDTPRVELTDEREEKIIDDLMDCVMEGQR